MTNVNTLEGGGSLMKPLRSAPTCLPYIVEIEADCDECGGSGFDPGGLDPWGPEPCRVCRGSKKQRVTRNFLAEAFQIAANPESTRAIERQHLVAVIQHCRETVSALVSLPDVTLVQPTAINRKRRKPNVALRP